MMKFAAALITYLLITAGSIFVWTNKPHNHTLSILAIFQNEDRFLREWIDYHLVVGVEHFYLYNNLSTDNFREVLKPYIDDGIVELYDWPYKGPEGSEAGWTLIQSAAYRDGLAKATGTTQWLAIIDTDEFLLPTSANTITEWLAGYTDCSGILINWQLFGTGGVEQIGDGKLMIEQLVMQTEPYDNINKYCKSIVRPELVKYCTDPHTVVYYPWTYSVDPNKNIFNWKFFASREINIGSMRLNHYWSRDEKFFRERKLARYTSQWGDESRRKACLERNASANVHKDTTITRFAEKIRSKEK